MEINQIVEEVAWNNDGLAPAILQERNSGDILMLAWMNRTALQATIADKYATFFSRSRGRIWRKGEESGHLMQVHKILLDCDSDVLLLEVTAVKVGQEERSVACHTGEHSCFFRQLDVTAADAAHHAWRPINPSSLPLHYGGDEILQALHAVIETRKKAGTVQTPLQSSYVAQLLGKGVDAVLKKIGEEATEVVMAAKDAENARSRATDGPNNSNKVGEGNKTARENLIGEMADLWFHSAVLLSQFDLSPADVLQELKRRQGLSGLAEKAARPQNAVR